MRKLWIGLMVVMVALSAGRLVAAQGKPEIPAIVLTGHEDKVTALAWSPDGSIVASSAGSFDSTDDVVRLWSRGGKLLATLEGHSEPVTALDWSPDGSTLATGSYDGTTKLWSVEGMLLNTSEPNKGVVFTVDWSPDGRLLASASLGGTQDNTIQIWSADGILLHTLPTQYSGGKFLNVSWSPDGQFLVGGAIDYKEWRTDGTLVFTHESCEHCTPAWGLAWSPDSTQWAIGNESGVVWVYGVDGTQFGYLQNSAGNVDVMAWSPDGRLLLGGNALWEWMGSEYKQRSGVGRGRVQTLAWSPDSALIAVAEVNQDDVMLWTTRGRIVATLEGHTDTVQTVAWSPDGSLLASAGEDRTVRLWEVSEAISVAD